jgi:membrane-associated phospholipid phosphatase
MVAVYLAWIAAFQVVGRYAAQLPTRDVTMGIDRAIPFVPGWVWIYELCYVIPFLPLVLVRDRRRIARGLLAAIVANAAAFPVYLILPLAWPLPDPGGTAAGRILALEQAADFHPGANKLPSMHVVFACLVLLVCRGREVHRGVQLTLVVVVGAICTSTVLVKQHLTVDVMAGVAWACLAWVAAGRLLPVVGRGATNERDLVRKIGLRVGVPTLLSVPVLIALRELLGSAAR